MNAPEIVAMADDDGPRVTHIERDVEVVGDLSKPGRLQAEELPALDYRAAEPALAEPEAVVVHVQHAVRVAHAPAVAEIPDTEAVGRQRLGFVVDIGRYQIRDFLDLLNAPVWCRVDDSAVRAKAVARAWHHAGRPLVSTLAHRLFELNHLFASFLSMTYVDVP
ncbi:MAG TPA: hypothetical protein PLP17_08930 [Oligoflexia bacterium]|nr:hypothetical protein [Oligoflexia bacterium]